MIRVHPGERVPLDGVVIKGKAYLDTSALTGESVPRRIAAGETIHSGVIVQDSELEIRVTALLAESTVSRILKLVEDASEKKSKRERMITRLAKIYTPVVVILAVLIAVFPPMLNLGSFREWIYKGMTLLIISCPCALVLSIPLSFFGGIGASARKGMLLKGSGGLERLARLKTIVFDKTGTLTEGTFKVTDIQCADKFSERELLHWTAAAE